MSFDFLPHWIVAAGAPALSVIAFFWTGDDALSQDFKKWLTQKILRVKLTVPDISSIEPLGKVFDFIFGRRYFALTTFLRTAGISIIAFAITLFSIAGDPISFLWGVAKEEPITSIVALAINVVFDYISVTKSRILIATISKLHRKYAVIIFIFVDLILTTIIIFGYFDLIHSQLEFDLNAMVYELWTFPYLPFVAFVLTTFLTLFLTTTYSVSLMLLMLFNFLGKTTYMRWLVPENILSIIRWVLPVDTLPVRSIGIVAGAFVFIFVAAFRAFT